MMNSTPTPFPNHQKNEFYYQKNLPPTPTSSTSTAAETTKAGSLLIPATSQNYGSLGNSNPYFESLSGSRPVTPSQTTISPDDNDEGLYLLWTHQLLRERGFTPSSCAPDEYAKDEHQEEDDDSSVSDVSSVSSGEEEEEESVNIEHYIAEQRKLFSPAPSSYAYSHRDSMVSRFSNTPVAMETARPEQTNVITAFFQSCFSSCL